MDPKLDDVILKKLQEYGDSVVEGGDKKKRKKSSSQKAKISEVSALEAKSCGSNDRPKDRKKKKKKKHNDLPKPEDVKEELEYTDDPELSGHEKRLHKMSEQLGLGEFKQQLLNRKEENPASSQKTKSEPEVIVFHAHKSKKARAKELDESKADSETSPYFNMKQARYDVRKFGIKGFEGTQKEEAMTALLIKLGAKPPKNKYLNYKDYQEERKRQMDAELQKRDLDRRMGLKVAKAGKGKKRPRVDNDIGHIDGQIGKWKSGMLVLSKDELKGFNKKPKLR